MRQVETEGHGEWSRKHYKRTNRNGAPQMNQSLDNNYTSDVYSL